MIVVLTLLEAYTRPSLLGKVRPNTNEEYSVWIVPGGVESEAGEDESEDLDDLLVRKGVRVLERVDQAEAQRCAQDILSKFGAAGLLAKEEFLCND